MALWPEALGLWEVNLVSVTFVFCARKRKSNRSGRMENVRSFRLLCSLAGKVCQRPHVCSYYGLRKAHREL
jgi:hypothetical protein